MVAGRPRGEMANNHSEIEKRLWESADQLRANSKLKSSEYSVPVLGLIFLRYADHKFAIAEKELVGKGSGRRAIGKEDYQARGVLYVPPEARYNRLRDLPDTANVGKAIEEAMAAIEAENDVLKGTFKAQYQKIDNASLKTLLKRFAEFEVDEAGDRLGKVYEYFLGNFARAEGQKGGEFFTPESLVQLIVEVIEPFHGKILDLACGSGRHVRPLGQVREAAQEGTRWETRHLRCRDEWRRPAASASRTSPSTGSPSARRPSGRPTATTKTRTRRSARSTS